MSPQFPSSKPRTPPPGAIHFRQTLPFPAEKDSQPRISSRWRKALLFSTVWLALLLSAVFVHTNVIRAGKIMHSEDSVLSERYGLICGAGLAAIAAFIFFGKRERH